MPTKPTRQGLDEEQCSRVTASDIEGLIRKLESELVSADSLAIRLAQRTVSSLSSLESECLSPNTAEGVEAQGNYLAKLSLALSGRFVMGLRADIGSYNHESMVTAFEEIGRNRIDTPRASACAHGFELLLLGFDDASAHVLLPRIEFLVRGIWVATIGATAGERPPTSITAGLYDLKGYIEESPRRHLLWALGDPPNGNLRNSLVHSNIAGARSTDAEVIAHAFLTALILIGSLPAL